MNEFTIEWLWSLILLIIPAYFANMLPPVFNPTGKGKASTAHPIDGGANFFDGRRIFGDGKSQEGFIGGLLGGTLVGALMGLLGFIPLGFSFDEWFLVSFALSLGTLVGDLVGSFIKRRLDLKRGEKFEYFDQLGFVVFSMAFASLIAPQIGYSIGFWGYVTLLFLSYFTHITANYIGFWIGVKSVPW